MTGRIRRAVVAPDKFKGSLSASEAAEAIACGLRSAIPGLELGIVPMADGGEGTVDAFVESGWQRVERTVRGPLGERVAATFALDGARAVIEMAEASGLARLAPESRDPSRATTFGTGELIRAALDLGARRIVVAVGGSATNDGGAGMLEALGARLHDAHGMALDAGGAALAGIATIDLSDLDPRLVAATIDVAADVDHVLTGPHGASAVFGPQKGATPEGVRRLDAALARFADVSARTLGTDYRDAPGSGAAGGLAFALRAFLGASLQPGVDLVADLRGLPAMLAGATFCATGEGSIDEQTLGGKTVDGVARLARDAGVPVVAFAGRATAEAERVLARRGAIVVPIAAGPATEREAMSQAAALLERAAFRVGRLVGEF